MVKLLKVRGDNSGQSTILNVADQGNKLVAMSVECQ